MALRLALKGRHMIAQGKAAKRAQPWVTRPHTPEPWRGDIGSAQCRPFGTRRTSRRLPGACAPGYLMPSLRDSTPRHDRAMIAQAQYEELVRLRAATGVN